MTAQLNPKNAQLNFKATAQLNLQMTAQLNVKDCACPVRGPPKQLKNR
jgi:hypothetical protein